MDRLEHITGKEDLELQKTTIVKMIKGERASGQEPRADSVASLIQHIIDQSESFGGRTKVLEVARELLGLYEEVVGHALVTEQDATEPGYKYAMTNRQKIWLALHPSADA